MDLFLSRLLAESLADTIFDDFLVIVELYLLDYAIFEDILLLFATKSGDLSDDFRFFEGLGPSLVLPITKSSSSIFLDSN